MRAFITGAAGFAGSHLLDYLREQTDWDIHAFVWEKADLRHVTTHDRLILYQGDIQREESLRKALQAARPDYVFHLAAIASVAHSYQNPGPTMMTNILGQVNLLQVLIELEPMPRTLIVGSADEYGLVKPDELPITEHAPLRPRNPYSVSKITQDMLGFQYFQSYGLPVVRVRPFNHIGPRQAPSFVVSAFAKQIADAEFGRQKPIIRVGNLDAQRDFSDVRDIVHGYHLAITQGEPGEVYNLASERSYAIQEILDRLIELGRVKLTIEPDPTRMRPTDTPIVRGDSHKFRARTGWRAQIPLQTSLEDTLDYWRESTNTI